jgi:hypothetical protein
MPKHNASKKDKKQSSQEPQIWEVNETNAEPSQAGSQDQPQERDKKIRWNEVIEMVAVLVAIAVCWIYWQQLQIMTRQLTEMEGSSSQTSQLIVNASHQASDTHTLAVAAGKQADAAKVQSEQTEAQVEKMTESLSKTDALITQATTQAKATNDLVEQAKHQTDLLKTQLEISNRPWVGIEGRLQVVGSIHTDPAHVNFIFDLKNVGKSVALGVGTGIWVGTEDEGFKLMESNHCEEQAVAERHVIELARQYEKHMGPKPSGFTEKTGSIILPDGIEHHQSAPQPGVPNRPAQHVYALFCAVYFDNLDTVHITQTTFCFTNQSGPLGEPVICGKGNYAY